MSQAFHTRVVTKSPKIEMPFFSFELRFWSSTQFCKKRQHNICSSWTSAQPNVSLSAQHIVITNGSAGFLRCKATGYVPQDTVIKWIKVSGDRETEINSADFGTAFIDASSVSSQLRIRPTMDDDGNKYRCVVTYTPSNTVIAQEAKLTVEEPTVPWPIIGGVIGGVSLIVLIILVLCCCCRRKQTEEFKKEKGSPQINLLTEQDQFKDGVASRIKWEVTGFTPRNISIALLLRRKGEEFQKLYDWNLINDENLENGEKGLLLNSSCAQDWNKKEDSITAEISNCTQLEDGTFSVKCTITVCPDAPRDDGAEVSLEVHHDTLKTPLTSSLKLVIERVSPQINSLTKPYHVKDGVASHIAWEVTGFTPRNIAIALFVRRKGEESQKLYDWNLINNEDPLKNGEKDLLLNSSCVQDGNKKEDSITAEISNWIQLEDGTFSVKCMITVCPDASRDDGAEVSLEVHHETLKTPLTSSFKLIIKRVSARINLLTKSNYVKHGVASHIAWEVTGFTPRNIAIALSLKRKKKESQKLYNWNLKNNEDLLFNSSCVQDGNKKEDSITAEISNRVQLEDGMFSVKCTITVCPDASEDDGAEVTLEVYQETITKRMNSLMKLVVEGVPPAVTEIDMWPEVKHSEVASLSWSVIGFAPKPISIIFFLKRKADLKTKRLFHWQTPEKGGIDDEPKIGSTALKDVREQCEEDDIITAVTPHCVRKNDGTFCVNCSIWMTADMCRDDGAELIVEVFHKALEIPLKTCMTLHVTGVPPTITEIKEPPEITPGELASLSWAIVGFSPQAINIVTFVKRKGEKVKKQVCHWRIPKKDKESQEAKTASVPLDNVTEGCEEDGSFTAVTPHYVQKNNGTFSVNCSVWLCADASQDDGAELMVEVYHEALKEPLIKSKTLHVTDGGN